MPDEPIICNCDDGCGLPHIHRNPPFDTEGRQEMHRRRQVRVVTPTRMQPFEDPDSEPDPPISPNEEERYRKAANWMEKCAVEMSRGDCENESCGDGSGYARRATLRVGRYNLCETCADQRDRGKPPSLIERRVKLEDLK
jgi:hypothetical protein